MVQHLAKRSLFSFSLPRGPYQAAEPTRHPPAPSPAHAVTCGDRARHGGRPTSTSRWCPRGAAVVLSRRHASLACTVPGQPHLPMLSRVRRCAEPPLLRPDKEAGSDLIRSPHQPFACLSHSLRPARDSPPFLYRHQRRPRAPAKKRRREPQSLLPAASEPLQPSRAS